MSKESTLVTAEHFSYLAARTAQEDAFLTTLKSEALAAGIPAIWIAAEQASFMQILLRLCAARRVVEIGTLAGYSAIAMARALPDDGMLRTIEKLEAHARFARRIVERSDVAGRVEVILGDAVEVLAGFQDNWADAAFIDADKASYPSYLRECLRIVRPGGLIMVDNAFAFGQLFLEHPTDREAPAMKSFNDQIARHPGLHSVIVPLGDGLWVGVREK